MKKEAPKAFAPLEKFHPVREIFSNGIRKRCSLTGFTLIEIIMVVVIIGIIAIVAVPKFMSFRQEAEQAAEDATIGAVQSGIVISTAAEEVRQ